MPPVVVAIPPIRPGQFQVLYLVVGLLLGWVAIPPIRPGQFQVNFNTFVAGVTYEQSQSHQSDLVSSKGSLYPKR